MENTKGTAPLAAEIPVRREVQGFPHLKCIAKGLCGKATIPLRKKPRRGIGLRQPRSLQKRYQLPRTAKENKKHQQRRRFTAGVPATVWRAAKSRVHLQQANRDSPNLRDLPNLFDACVALGLQQSPLAAAAGTGFKSEKTCTYCMHVYMHINIPLERTQPPQTADSAGSLGCGSSICFGSSTCSSTCARRSSRSSWLTTL